MGWVKVTTISNLNPICIDLEVGFGCDNIDSFLTQGVGSIFCTKFRLMMRRKSGIFPDCSDFFKQGGRY